MAKLHDFFFRQRVTEQELDEGFEFLEEADHNMSVDHGLVGITNGMGVAATVGPSLNVDIGSGAAYSKSGKRIRVAGTQTVDCSVDENSVSTEPVTPGNSLVVTIFAEFVRDLSDPRVDGNSQVVFFNRFEDFAFKVRKGGEATTPAPGSEEAFINANGVANDSELIRVIDIIRTNGDGTIDNSEIYTTRREDAFAITIGTAPSPVLTVDGGTPKESDTQILQHLHDHLTDTGAAHDSASLAWDRAGKNWANTGGTIESAADVESALHAVLDDLADSTTGASGAHKIAYNASSPSWANLTFLGASDVGAALTEIVSDLAQKIGSDGAGRVGYDPSTVDILPGSDNVASALNDLANNWGRLGRSNTWFAKQIFLGTASTLEFSESGATNESPTVDYPSNTLSSNTVKKLLFRSAVANGNLRVYIHGEGLDVTLNAEWDDTANTWGRDVAQQSALMRLSDQEGFIMVRRLSSEADNWADNSWHAASGSRTQFEVISLGDQIEVTAHGVEVGGDTVKGYHAALDHNFDTSANTRGHQMNWPVHFIADPTSFTRNDDKITPAGMSVNPAASQTDKTGCRVIWTTSASSTGTYASTWDVS